MRIFFVLIMSCFALPVVAQFAPQADVTGSTAISRNDARIVDWALDCKVTQGWLDIADKSQGFVSFGSESNATGKSDNGVVSLGDSGIAVLTFSGVIYNGEGPDFVVFENGFVNPANPEEAFLELAFVEVSSDGVNYVRFPASSQTDTPQIPVAGVYMNARKLHNLAGKYKAGYGTPFDLEELKGIPELDIDNITHVRLVDVIGSVTGNGSIDKDGHFVNDPYPTAIPSGGFDLDAVGVLHSPGKWPATIGNTTKSAMQIYPNPAHDKIRLQGGGKQLTTAIVQDVTGRTVLQYPLTSTSVELDIRQLNNGVYYLVVYDVNGEQWVERFNKY